MAGGSESSSQPVDVTPRAFRQLQQPFANVIGQLIGFEPQTGRRGRTTGFEPTGDPSDVLRGIPTFEGPFAAPIGGAEQNLLQQLMQTTAGQGGAAGGGAAQDLLTRTIGGEFLPGEAGANPFLESAIQAAQRTTLRGLEETLGRTLPGRFTQAGQFVQPQGTSAFDRAAAVATEGVSAELADIASQLGFAGFEAERGRQQEAAQALPQVTGQEVQNLIQNLQAQALPRMIEQAGIEGGLEQFNRSMSNLLQVLAVAQGTTAPVIAQETQSSQKGSAAPFLQLGGSALGIV